jgi:hypothetical protein
VLSWDVLKSAGFLCGDTAISWDREKGKSGVSLNSESMRYRTRIRTALYKTPEANLHSNIATDLNWLS